jgi:hypothetical protein
MAASGAEHDSATVVGVARERALELGRTAWLPLALCSMKGTRRNMCHCRRPT